MPIECFRRDVDRMRHRALLSTGVKEEQEQQRLSDGAGGGGSATKAARDAGVALESRAGGGGGGGGAPGSGGDKTSSAMPSMRESLHALMKRLSEKRRDGDRPEDLTVSHAAHTLDLTSYDEVQSLVSGNNRRLRANPVLVVSYS